MTRQEIKFNSEREGEKEREIQLKIFGREKWISSPQCFTIPFYIHFVVALKIIVSIAAAAASSSQS